MSDLNPQTPADPLGLTDKSLDHEIESKETARAAAAGQGESAGEFALPEVAAGEVPVVMLHYSDHDGVPLVPGQTVALPRVRAEKLIAAHRAVAAD